MRRSALPAAAVVAALPLLGGCAGGLELAALGAVANAAKTGGTAIKFGKVDLAVMTTPEVAADAVYATFDELDMRVFFDGTSEDKLRREIVAMNPRGNEYKFLLKPVTNEVTFLRLDIGLLGNNSVGQLIMTRLRTNLETNGVDVEPE